MIQLPGDFDSIFRYIVVVSQRAEQLINGAKPRATSRHAKATLIAKDDVDGGEVSWRVLTQEELDAQRQEIVDQFRAEMGAEETVVRGGEAIPDVLPTAAAVRDDERDDELTRLQRLLGMATVAVDDEADENEDGDLEDEGDSFDLDDAEPLDDALDIEDGGEEADED